MWSVGYFFANLLECLPISQSWASAPGQGNPACIDALPMYFSQVYSDVALDCMIIVVPIPFGKLAAIPQWGEIPETDDV